MGLKEKLDVSRTFAKVRDELPNSAGVYIFKDGNGKVIYVGKAAMLRDRVKSYFQPSRSLGPRLEAMVSCARDIEWFVTPSEAEALLFEANLIKEYHPKYNVAYRDDKSYPLIKITMTEEYPSVFVTRGRKNDGSLYFGPYSNAKLLRKAVKSIRTIFPFCTCHPLPKKACIYYGLGLCPAPCEGKISKDEYDETVKKIILFIEGKRDELLRKLSYRMASLAQSRRFEEASKVKDQVQALGKVIIKRPKVDIDEQLDELKEVLDLKKEPKYIEAFDISNIKGEGSCGSMVAFLDGKPYKSNYKMFRIKEVEGQDDYAMMREVVRRRYRRALEEKRALPSSTMIGGRHPPSFWRMPDLILIDGGKGHLSSAAQEIKVLGIRDIPIIGIAKVFEHIYTLDRDEPILLPPTSKALHLIQRIRDESHRFAIRYHHILRRRITRESALDEIPSIGPKRKAALLKHFGSIEGIKKATIEELTKVKGLSEKVAREIKKALHSYKG